MGNFPLLTFHREGKSRDDVGIKQRIDISASKDGKGITDFVCGGSVNSDVKSRSVLGESETVLTMTTTFALWLR